MNKKVTSGLIVIISIFFILNIASVCYAQDAGKKLGRGLVNILTGWLELPKNIYETSAKSNPLAGITIGLAKGLGMTVVRTGAGIYETATFPLALPQDYKPILEPEYVLNKEK
ncbi:MAG: exosortase system-associated protein, TIGR04073 family [Candidatus Omnitrophica bacterium]|nr:exosortase system-associated protein, TIGR04073 family [Candidatus Omnitrophota bacterium]